ncbi:MAG: hypothetical protein AB4426_22690 [Xenococcaceae cyanobacterium]
MKRLLVWLFIVIIWTLNCHPVYAETSADFLASSQLTSQEFSSTRKVGEQITLEELGLEDWHHTSEDILTETQLLRLSIRLRDIARYLGSSWPVIVPIPEAHTRNVNTDFEGRSLREITDFRTTSGNWITLTTGHALRMVTQELQILENSEPQPLIDFLVRDKVTETYRPLLDVPLDRYCYELFQKVKLRN